MRVVRERERREKCPRRGAPILSFFFPCSISFYIYLFTNPNTFGMYDDDDVE